MAMMTPAKIRSILLPVLCAVLPAFLPAQALPLEGIAHVAIQVKDLQQSRSFYEKLGFEQAFKFEDNGVDSYAFIKVNDHQFIELYPGKPGSSAGLLHICFEVADLAALGKQYAAAGLSPTASAKGRAGNLLFLLRGPTGGTYEFVQYLPGSLHTSDRGKHLGPERISGELIGAALPERDVEHAKAFFADRLGFTPLPGSQARLRLPGNSGQVVLLETPPSGTPVRMLFRVRSAKRTAAELRKRQFTVQATPHAASVSDPDGNVLEFTDQPADSK